MRAWLRENRKSLLGLVPIVLVTIAVSWVLFDSIESGEFEGEGEIWKVKATDGDSWKINVLFGHGTLGRTEVIFRYYGELPVYANEGEYVALRYYLDHDNSEILEFQGLAEEPSPILFPSWTLLAVLGVIVLAVIVVSIAIKFLDKGAEGKK